MATNDYQKTSIENFMGYFVRGLNDTCPPDHSPVCQNMKFYRNGSCKTRDGTKKSFTAPTKVVRMFVATFGHTDQTGIVLTCDGAGNIYRSDTGGVLLSISDMVDFAAINVFSYCLISPIITNPNTPADVYIWSGHQVSGADAIPIRIAAGYGPVFTGSSGMTGAESSTAGDCDIGVHQFGVSFITNTGYTTNPGPMQIPGYIFTPTLVTSTGNLSITLSGIPTGPPDTVARQILVTQADQTLFFYAGGQIQSGGSYIPWDGVIHDNTTTSITISFFDTDLGVSADSLFDLLPTIPAGNYGLVGGMTTYHGRVFYWGGEFNLIRVTNPGSAESIDNIAGWIQIPDQFDGNDVNTSITIQDALFFLKGVGIFVTTDNSSDPNTWEVVCTDAGVGSAAALSLGTVNLTTPSQSQDLIFLVADYGGLYTFTGAVTQPPLTWKINDFWLQLQSYTNLQGTMIAVDPFLKLIYVAVTGNAIGQPGWANLLVGDYNDGLDPQNIKWSVWAFPWAISSIGMAFLQDTDELAYRLRIAGPATQVYKYFPGSTTDDGAGIVSVWRSFYHSPALGNLNVHRYIRSRMPFYDNLSIHLYSEDDAIIVQPPGFNIPYFHGRDLVREFNFMDEKMAVEICCTATQGGFWLQRMDIFAKSLFAMRPQV